ncbi:hypothetical protein Ddye_011826 [Dipteronia dyeriana]|uniref:Uncharacterized protein n=1 Tax=Dipteronia dyeriana TaxID=168575 RepID=A0AAE0CHQ1_9ROSI|nr:hypothetical protein Ddye_011826 [Dipteronia dyeriana]
MRILDSNTMEVWAVKKVADLCLSNENFRGRFISIVSDSKVVVSWVNNGEFRNIGFVNEILDIRNTMKTLGGVEVVHDLRVFNFFTDSSVKMGSSESGDFVE